MPTFRTNPSNSFSLYSYFLFLFFFVNYQLSLWQQIERVCQAHPEEWLLAWQENIDRHRGQWSAEFDDRFFRMWRYYLLACAGFFRSRHGQLWQIVLAGPERREAYRSIRLACE